MTGRRVSTRRRVAAGVGLAAIAAVAAVGFWPRALAPASPGHDEHGAPVAAIVSPPSPAPYSPVAPAPDDAPETEVGGSAETSLLAAAGERPDSQRDTSTLDERGAVDPDEVLGDGGLGGCLTEYGTAGQCLPVYPPSLSAHVQDMVDAGQDPSSMPHDWDCAELRLYFSDGVAVRVTGTDPQHLDTDLDGIACEPGQDAPSSTPTPENTPTAPPAN